MRLLQYKLIFAEMINNKTSIHIQNTANKQTRWHWIWAAPLIVLTLATLVFRYALPIRDGDIFFHLLYARYFLENFTLIPDHTIFSWTPTDGSEIYCAWLSELVLYGIYKLGDLKGLYAFRYFCILLFVYAAWRFARKNEVDNHPLTWLCCLLGVLISYVGIFAKPEGFTYIFFTLFCWNWFYIKTTNNNLINFYIFPLIMLVWINSHGAFIFGMIFLLTVFTGELLNIFTHKQALTKLQQKHLFFSIILSLTTIFLTPYGYHYPLKLLYTLLPTPENAAYNQFIVAMNRPFTVEGEFLSFAELGDMGVILLVTLLLLNLKFHKIDWSLLTLNFVFVLLYTRYIRTTFYWAPIFTFSSLYLISLRHPFIFPSLFTRKLLIGIASIFLSCFLAVIAFNSERHAPENYLWMGFGYSEMLPVEEAKYIKTYFPNAKIGNTYNTGTYLLWKLWPKNKIFIDARHFPYRNWSQEYFKFEAAINVEQFLGKFPADIWCIDLLKTKLWLWFVNSPDWKVAFYGKSSVVFVKNDTSLPPLSRKVSNDVTDIKSRSTFFPLLMISTKIQDWKTARKLITSARSLAASAREQERFADFTAAYVEGLMAYHQGDFEKATKQLESAHEFNLVENKRALSYVYQALMINKMSEGDIPSSYELSVKALENSKNIFTIYNAGILGWKLSHQENIPVLENQSKDVLLPSKWRELLEEFQTMKKPAQEPFLTAVKQVHTILAGKAPLTPPSLLIGEAPSPFKQFDQQVLPD